jgi:hypothetical protein
MRDLFTSPIRLASGRFKAAILGHPRDHVSNWRGANYHYVIIKGQPKQGFATEQEASHYISALPLIALGAELKRAKEAVGTFYRD